MNLVLTGDRSDRVQPLAIEQVLADASVLPRVTILLAALNGARFVDAQLDSIAAQSHRRWTILASDDGSTDGTRQALERHRKRGLRIEVVDGPGNGAAANFLSLMRRVDPECGEWLALCDQDDVWLPERLSRGLCGLAMANAEDPRVPRLYCGRTWVTDAHLGQRRLSTNRPKPASFRNALAQNLVPGNTVLMNPAAARLIAAAAQEAGPVVAHDWWCYLLVTGAGGEVIFDPTPTLLYRQHGGNQVGANDGTAAKLKRLGQVLRGQFRDWNDQNIAALRRSAHRLTPENRALLEAFAEARSRRVIGRLAALRRIGLYRQTRAATLSLWLAALFGKL